MNGYTPFAVVINDFPLIDFSPWATAFHFRGCLFFSQ